MISGNLRNAVILGCAFLLIATLIFSNYLILTRTGNQLHDQVDAMIAFIQHEEWSKAAITWQESKNYWRSIRVFWRLFAPHQEVDTFEEAQAQLLLLIDVEDRAQAMQVLGGMREDLEQILGRATFVWVNVL